MSTSQRATALTRYTNRGREGLNGRELPPFELPGVSKIEFATDRRSFATRSLIPPGIQRSPSFCETESSREARRISGYSGNLRFVHEARSCNEVVKDVAMKECFAAINCALVRNFRAAGPHCNRE